jgi:NAD(P)-dependent dehydrogenase (short-subunit alcohol dehydrogenase family)
MYPTSLDELFSLTGRVALVTGASGDLGRAMAHALGLAGASLALTGRSEERLQALQQELPVDQHHAACFPADLCDLEAIPRLVDTVMARFGQIDILVNCAGINLRQPFLEVRPETYNQIMDTNLRAMYFLCQSVARQMIVQGGGKIINVGSLTSAIGLADVSVYGMTKGATAQLTKALAVELAEHNICVNCICPGFMVTQLTVPLWDNPRRRSWMLDRLPLKKPGQPGDLLGITVYLASSASDYMTGQTIYLDGGFLAGSQW